jgi:hypothetical protein
MQKKVSQEVSDGVVFVGSGIQFVGTTAISTGSSAIEIASGAASDITNTATHLTFDDIQQSIPTSLPNVSDMMPDMSTPQDAEPEAYEETFPGQFKVLTCNSLLHKL